MLDDLTWLLPQGPAQQGHGSFEFLLSPDELCSDSWTEEVRFGVEEQVDLPGNEMASIPFVCQEQETGNDWFVSQPQRVVRPAARAFWALLLRSETKVHGPSGRRQIAQLEYFPSQALARSPNFHAFLRQSKFRVGAEVCVCPHGEAGYASVDEALLALQQRRDAVLENTKTRKLLWISGLMAGERVGQAGDPLIEDPRYSRPYRYSASQWSCTGCVSAPCHTLLWSFGVDG
eukprot:gnl/MRDRNA2_/MRDRNA2_144205_c0_seq1.p1 gnl/MRDRNA2_/MRDRNA2_144205_c0~~gnl/MRDRNA2_/MRDRNA2_144205_c0_seq1.p1  ORF type:complete len:232 (+),score=39.50 gnl/MRDRNA2_/MRDRNA2_144205_c0_seq1:101-796(+)